MDLSKPAAQIFQILQTYNATVMLYDDEGNKVLDDPSAARRMFVPKGNLMVALIDDGDNSAVRFFVGKGTDIASVAGLSDALRTAATGWNLLFNMRQHGEVITPKSFSSQSSVREVAKPLNTNKQISGTPPKRIAMNVFEGMYGTSRSSYLALEHAKMIVRHSAKVDESKIGARSRFVESIFIENDLGERFLFPTTSLAPARAMAQHINHDGVFGDVVGESIQEMAKSYAALSSASRHIYEHATILESSAQTVRETCRTQMREMRRVFEKMYRPSGYVAEARRITENAGSLNENEAGASIVSLDRLNEMRSLLQVEGVEVPDHVLEAACSCMDKHNVEEDMLSPREKLSKRLPNEKKTPMTSVLGVAVSERAWADFKNGVMPIRRQPPVRSLASFTNKTEEIVYKVGNIATVVEDDGMSNLLNFVCDRLPEEHDERQVKIMRAIGLKAIAIVSDGVDEGLSPKNMVVREFAEWIGNFSTNQRLAEGYLDFAPPGLEQDEDESERVSDEIMREFSPQEFLDSEQMADLLNDYEEPNTVTHDDIMRGLESYLSQYAQLHYQTELWDTNALAGEVYAEVAAAFEQRGYTIQNDVEMAEDMGEMGDELTREDILLPSPNKGDDLASEVTTKSEIDPETGQEELPDSGYLSRLRTLAGVTTNNQPI